MPDFGPIRSAGTRMFVKTAKANLNVPRYTGVANENLCGVVVSHTFSASVDAKYRPDCTSLLLDYVSYSISASLAAGESGNAFTGSGLTITTVADVDDAVFTGAGFVIAGPSFIKPHSSGNYVEFSASYSSIEAKDVCDAVIGNKNKLSIAKFGFDPDTCTPKQIASTTISWLQLSANPASIETVNTQLGINAGLSSLASGGIPSIASWGTLAGTTKTF